MFSLAYNANGLRDVSIEDAIKMTAETGYKYIELSLHKNHINPLNYTDKQINSIKNALKESKITAASLATGADNLLSDIKFEPSLVTADKNGRNKRIRLIKIATDIARELGIPIVSFASGNKDRLLPCQDAYKYLKEGIKECLDYAGNGITLAIEPEPGMFIETSDSAKSLVCDIGSINFRINLDIGHVECCEPDLYKSLMNVIGLTVHIHIEDIKNKIHHHEIPGEGDLDFEKILGLLKDYNYNGAVSVELYHHNAVAQEALSKSYNYLSGIINKINSAK